jgi:hypothetical protein
MSTPASSRCFSHNNRSANPQTTVEAIMVAVRKRGVAALEEAANVELLVRCDQVARRQ